MIARKLVLFTGIAVTLNAVASELEDMSLEELMEVKVNVASGSEKPIREAPVIITVIDSIWSDKKYNDSNGVSTIFGANRGIFGKKHMNINADDLKLNFSTYDASVPEKA